MAILPTHSTFRWYACTKTVCTPTATFQDLNPDRIIRTDMGGDYTVDGIADGMTVIPSGTASNDDQRYLVDTVTAATLLLDAGAEVVAEGPLACTLTGIWVDPDGLEEFPGPFGHTNLVRSGGFTGGFTGIPQPYTGTTFDVTVNAYAADAVPGTDEYHWYLSQRTDDPAKRYLSIVPYTNVVGQTYSGSVTINHTAVATAEIGVAAISTIAQTIELFKLCHLYVVRVSDGAIQWVDVLRRMLNAA